MIRRLSDMRPVAPQDLQRHRVSVWDMPKLRRRVRARNERVMGECVVCHRFVCPLLHDTPTCAQRHGLDGDDLYRLERGG